MKTVKRSSAAGKRVIQTRWVDREQDGCVKSSLVLKDFHRDQGRTQPEMFAPTPSTLSLKTMLAGTRMIETITQAVTTSQLAIDAHTAFLHADIDQELFAQPPEKSELCEDEVWKLHKALYGYRKAPKLRHQHVGTLLESVNFCPLPADPSCSEMMNWTSIFSFMLMTDCFLARVSKFNDSLSSCRFKS